jgi:prolyl-tRNA synthetase
MKDLYTFDYSTSQALATYDEVRNVYAGLFDELKLPYLMAQADSGDMGGNLSHEFHFPTTQGEDYIISCENSCGYMTNEELAESPIHESLGTGSGLQVWRGISRDRRTLINVWFPPSTPRSTSKLLPEVNPHAIKAIIPELDPSIENSFSLWVDPPPKAGQRRLVNLVDGRLPDSVRRKIESSDPEIPYWPDAEQFPEIAMETIFQNSSTQRPLNLLRIREGDPCPECNNGTLNVQKAIELGHTFHLGTRYSDPLKATVAVPAELLEDGSSSTDGLAISTSTSSQEVPMQMGCHGIGVSRIIGAVADTLADEKGLNWPRIIAPYEIVVVPGKGLEDAAVEVYDTLSHSSKFQPHRDVILDDRADTFPWKMRDADLVGYPVIVVVGRRWNSEGMCEVQCRRLNVREEIPMKDVPAFVDSLLDQL